MADLEKLDNAINELEKQSNDLKDFNTVYSEIASLKKEINDNLEVIKRNNEGLSEISKTIDKYLAEIAKKVEEIYKDNKAFQKDLDGTLITRLDKLKSDIQIEIRNANQSAINSIEKTIDNKLSELNKNITESFNNLKRKSNTNTILIIVLSVITITAFIINRFYMQ